MSPLSARLLISLAWMYVKDFQEGYDFGRMVDAKGNVFPTANKNGWTQHINNIIGEPDVRRHWPEQVDAIIAAMKEIGITVGEAAQ